MIPRSRSVAALCIALAGTLHAVAAALPTGSSEDVALAGGGGPTISTLGDSFADMAEGASVPEPETTPAEEPAQTPQPPVTETPTAETPMEAPTPPVATTAALAPLPETAQPVEQVPAPVPDPVARITADTETAAPEKSVRPPTRPEPTRHAAATPQQPGNADRSARAGNATGQETARAQQGAQSQRAGAQPGNAAAENYPGQVTRHIQRTRRERVNIRGSAQVSFTIASNGTLATLGIARSSGSERLDQIALQQIRRAAPFPPPPAGAKRNFTLRIDSR